MTFHSDFDHRISPQLLLNTFAPPSSFPPPPLFPLLPSRSNQSPFRYAKHMDKTTGIEIIKAYLEERDFMVKVSLLAGSS